MPYDLQLSVFPINAVLTKSSEWSMAACTEAAGGGSLSPTADGAAGGGGVGEGKSNTAVSDVSMAALTSLIGGLKDHMDARFDQGN